MHFTSATNAKLFAREAYVPYVIMRDLDTLRGYMTDELEGSAMAGLTFEETRDGKLYIKLQLLHSGYGEERLIEVAKGVLTFVLAEFDMQTLKAFNETLGTPKTYDA